MMTNILRAPAVIEIRGRGHSTHYRNIQEGLFTRPVPIGRRAVGWPAYEVHLLNQARIASMTDDEIRNVVVRLEAARTAGMAVKDNSDQREKLEQAGGSAGEGLQDILAWLASRGVNILLAVEAIHGSAAVPRKKPADPKADWISPLRKKPNGQ